jgi:hypothetical protein
MELLLKYPISVEMLQKVRIGKMINNFIKNLEGMGTNEASLLNQAKSVV